MTNQAGMLSLRMVVLLYSSVGYLVNASVPKSVTDFFRVDHVAEVRLGEEDVLSHPWSQDVPMASRLHINQPQWLDQIQALGDESFLIWMPGTWSHKVLESIHDTGLMEEKPWLFSSCGSLEDLDLKLTSLVFCLAWDRTWTIREIYRVQGNHLYNQVAFTYHPGSDDTEGDQMIWRRRSNLSNVTLTVLVLSWGGYDEVHVKDNEVTARGMYHDIVFQLQDICQFQILFRQPRDGRFGSRQPNGTWDGVIGELMAHEADFTSIAYVNLEQRTAVVDFTVPVGFADYTLLMGRSSKRSIQTTKYFEPFFPFVWLSLGLSLLLVFSMRSITIPRTGSQSVFGTMLVFLIQRGSFPRTRWTGERGIWLTWGLMAFVIFAHYSAIFTTNLTVADPPVEVSSLEDLYFQKIQLVLTEGDFLEIHLKSAPRDSVLSKLYEETIRDNPEAILINHLDSIPAILRDPNKALFASLSHKTDELVDRRVDTHLPRELGFLFPKNSELKPMVDYFLKILLETGVRDRITQKYVPLEHKNGLKFQHEFEAISLPMVAFPIAALVGGTVISGVMLVLENLVFSLQNKKCVQF